MPARMLYSMPAKDWPAANDRLVRGRLVSATR
jgi:hypothetical protein